MNYYPRSATVRARRLRDAGDAAQCARHSATNKLSVRTGAQLPGRALDSHLRSVPVFRPLTKDFIDQFGDRVELIRYQPGQ